MEPDQATTEQLEVANDVNLGVGPDPYLVGAGVVALLLGLTVVALLLLRRSRGARTLETEQLDSLDAESASVQSTDDGLLPLLRAALSRSRAALQGRFDEIFSQPVDDALFEELEEVLIRADIGMTTTNRIIDRLRSSTDKEATDLRQVLQDEVRSILLSVAAPLNPPPKNGPWVILVVGVNGSGKTTTIGKLAARLRREGKRVLLAAADTYRAAASDQLKVWAERAEVGVVSGEPGSDPGAVVFDALASAKAKEIDVVIIDTAGRLQTRKPLMEQLSKINRIIQKHVPDGPHETLLVVDGTMGQNALSQTELFNEATPLTGVAVTKLDGTAKGGVVVTIASEMKLPVKLIGLGEQVDDLRDFDAETFVAAIT